jgi:hypothetical protein
VQNQHSRNCLTQCHCCTLQSTTANNSVSVVINVLHTSAAEPAASKQQNELPAQIVVLSAARAMQWQSCSLLIADTQNTPACKAAPTSSSCVCKNIHLDVCTCHLQDCVIRVFALTSLSTAGALSCVPLACARRYASVAAAVGGCSMPYLSLRQIKSR